MPSGISRLPLRLAVWGTGSTSRSNGTSGVLATQGTSTSARCASRIPHFAAGLSPQRRDKNAHTAVEKRITRLPHPLRGSSSSFGTVFSSYGITRLRSCRTNLGRVGSKGVPTSSPDVLTFGLDENPFRNEQLIEDVIEAFGADELWCERDYFGLNDDAILRFGWQRFAETVKHETRYLFTLTSDEDGSADAETIHPGRFVHALGTLVERVDLLRTIRPETPVFRAREHAKVEEVGTGSALGSPPTDCARIPNRMSPAGIPMFYGSFEPATATAEIEPFKAGCIVTSGIFRLARPIVVVDLCDLPPIPSLFDRDPDLDRSSLLFLHDFARDLAKPIQKDGPRALRICSDSDYHRVSEKGIRNFRREEATRHCVPELSSLGW